MNPDDILCEHCNKYPVYRDDKCIICLEKDDPIVKAVATTVSTIDLLDLRYKWKRLPENDR